MVRPQALAHRILRISNTTLLIPLGPKGTTVAGIVEVVIEVVVLILAVAATVALIPRIFNECLETMVGKHKPTGPKLRKSQAKPMWRTWIANHLAQQTRLISRLILKTRTMGHQEGLPIEHRRLAPPIRAIRPANSALLSSRPNRYQRAPDQKFHKNSMLGRNGRS